MPATDGGLPSTAPCLTGGNVMWLQATSPSFWYTGTETLGNDAMWAAEAYAYYFVWDGTYLQAEAADAAIGERWTLSFNTWNLDAGVRTGLRHGGGGQ